MKTREDVNQGFDQIIQNARNANDEGSAQALTNMKKTFNDKIDSGELSFELAFAELQHVCLKEMKRRGLTLPGVATELQ